MRQFVSKLLSSTSALIFALQPTLAMALPTGGMVNGGVASIDTQGSTTTITQSSGRAVIDWGSFDVAHGESVNFAQPDVSSITFNRIHDSKASFIDGAVNANGNVWFSNANGMVFGQNASVNVGGLLATTANISDANFMAGDFRFDQPGNADAGIANFGGITARDAGMVAFVAPNVVNNGIIRARLGKIHLGSGDTFAFDPYGDGLISLQVSDAVKSQLVSNSGALVAEGGEIALTAAAARDSVNSLINMDGLISATALNDKAGKVTLYAEGSNAVKGNVAADKGKKTGTSTVLVSGSIDASGYGAGERGGNIDILGDNIGILNGAYLNVSGHSGLSGITDGGLLSDHRDGAAGGSIRLGGDYLGQGDTPGALNLFVDTYTLFYADSTGSGDAGRAIFWSDHDTSFAGNVYARALGASGNGGFVETSGHHHLDAMGFVDLTSANGKKGTYFLDPTDITIYGNVDPAFISTDGTINLSTNLKLWLDASDTSNVQLTYNTMGTTATGTSGTNTITVGSNAGLTVGARIRLGSAGSVTAASTVGADTYTITNISGTTITLSSNLTTNYSGSTVFQGYVNQLTDKSGQGNNATQSTASAMPLWISNGQNGIGVAQFDGSNDKLINNTLSWSNSAYSVYATALLSVSGGGFGYQRLFNGSSAADSYLFLGTYNGNYATFTGNGGAWNDVNQNSSATSLLSNYSILGMVVNGSALNPYVNGVAQNTKTGTTGAFTGFTIGDGTGSGSNQQWNGKISEITAYNTNLSTNAQDLINQYQSAKWGIALTPPGTGATEVAQATASDGYSVFTTRYLERLSQSADISLQATNNITLDLKSDTLAMASGRSLTLTAGNDILSASAGTIQTSGTGNITLAATRDINLTHDVDLVATGSGSVTLRADNSILYSGSGDITTSGGNILLNSDRDASGAGAISLGTGSNLTSNNGNITLGGGSGTITAGVLNADGSLNTAATGFAYGTSSNAVGVLISGGTVNAGSGTIIANGIGYNGSANGNTGVRVTATNGALTTTGSISVSGTGSGNTNSGSSYGVSADTAGVISGGTGTTVIGTGGGAGTGEYNYGVNVSGSNSTIRTTGAGALRINGTGGSSAAGYTAYWTGNNGVYTSVANGIQSTGSGDIVVYGKGGGTNLGGSGVLVSAVAGLRANGTGNITVYGEGSGFGAGNQGVNATNGSIVGALDRNVTVTGVAGAGGSSSGIYIGGSTSAGISTTGTGTVTVTGNNPTGGGDGGTGRYGVYLATGSISTENNTVNVQSTNANIGIDGRNGTSVRSTGSGNIVVSATNTGTTTGANAFFILGGQGIRATGTGTITVTADNSGKTGGGYGVGLYLNDGGVITGANNITLNGTGYGATQGVHVIRSAFGSSSSVFTTGAGNITINSPGLTEIQIANGVQTTGTGNVTINSNTIALGQANNINSAGTVTIAPFSQNGTIGLNGAAGTLGLTSTFLGYITGTSLTVGRSDGTGLMRVAGANLSSSTFGNLSLLNGSANIQFDGGATTLSLAANKNYTATTTTGSISGSGNGTIQVSGTGSITLDSGNLIVFGSGEDVDLTATGTGSVTLRAKDTIRFSGSGDITTNGGNIVLNSDSDASGAGAISLGSGTNIVSGGGNISLGGGSGTITAGSGYAYGEGTNTAGITLSNALLDSGVGNIIMNGRGFTGGTNTGSAYGIVFTSGGGVTTSGTNSTGTITMNGIGGGSGTGANNFGVYFNGANSATVINGNMTITGTGGTNSTGGNNYGIYVNNSGGNVQTTGTGTLTLIGTGGGTASDSTGGNEGIRIGTAGRVRSTAAGGGALTMTGYGGNTGGSGASNHGISNLLGTISSVDGNITLNGNMNTTTGQTVTNSTGNTNYGIHVQGEVSTTGNGTINLNGLGGGSGASSSNHGVNVADNGSGYPIFSTTGNIAINGTGGVSGKGLNFNSGVWSKGAANIALTGTGVNDLGIHLLSTVRSTAASGGGITITGYGGNSSYGFYSQGGSVTSVDGNIVLNGNTNTTTGQTTGTNSGGIQLLFGTYSSSGNATVSVNGTGTGSGVGLSLLGPTITAVNSDISLNGTGGSTNATGINIASNSTIIRTTGTGNITLTGIGGGSGTGIINSTTLTLGGASDNGNISLIADTLSLGSSTTFQTLQNVIFRPYSQSGTIGFNGATGSLNITSAILGGITAGTLHIGRTDGTGLMRVAGYDASARNWSLSLLNGSGNIQYDGGTMTMGTNKSFSTAATSGSFTTNATGSIVTSGTGDITIDDPMTLGGNLTLTSANALTFGGTVNGAHNLTASAGTMSLASAWGGSTPLAAVSLTTTNALSLPAISSSSLFARTTGASDITVNGTLTASGAGNALTLASGKNIVNNGSLNLTGGGRWLLYSGNPALDTKGGLSGYTKRYNKTYAGYGPGSVTETGNVWLYSIAPTVTVTANNASRAAGVANPSFTASYSGFIDADTFGTALTGAPSLSTLANSSSAIGSYAITTAVGSLASSLGYGFSFADGVLNVTNAPPSTVITSIPTSARAYSDFRVYDAPRQPLSQPRLGKTEVYTPYATFPDITIENNPFVLNPSAGAAFDFSRDVHSNDFFIAIDRDLQDRLRLPGRI